MEIVLWKMLFIACVSASEYGKHVYVSKSETWSDAQAYCRKHYTDLSPITTRWAEKQLKKATTGKVVNPFWIGLYRQSGGKWMWSGGAGAGNITWDVDEPDENVLQWTGSVCFHNCNWKGWRNSNHDHIRPFFCLNLIPVKIQRNWEDAMEYCRKQHTTLTSLPSKTDNLLALNKIQQFLAITVRVWIGLRYLEDSWLWVDGHPLRYQAWLQGGEQDHQCPTRKRCGALTIDGLWENRDCVERLYFICY